MILQYQKDITEKVFHDSSNQSGITTDVRDRLISIKTDISTGFSAGRGLHWTVSWDLFRQHPWPAFDVLPLTWLRPLVGYGPDLFRYAYLLKSPPATDKALPHEPDHAHNYFIHQAVEMGLLGLASSLLLFCAVFWSFFKMLSRIDFRTDKVATFILFGLVALIAGRFFEMMVGVARVSDLTILWISLAVFVALPYASFFRLKNNPKKYFYEIPAPKVEAQSRTSNKARRSLLWIKPVVSVFGIVGVSIFIWQTNVNYVMDGNINEFIRNYLLSNVELNNE